MNQLSWVCKITDIFANIEGILYLKYPYLKYKSKYYLANGCMLDKSKP